MQRRKYTTMSFDNEELLIIRSWLDWISAQHKNGMPMTSAEIQLARKFSLEVGKLGMASNMPSWGDISYGLSNSVGKNPPAEITEYDRVSMACALKAAEKIKPRYRKVNLSDIKIGDKIWFRSKLMPLKEPRCVVEISRHGPHYNRHTVLGFEGGNNVVIYKGISPNFYRLVTNEK